MSLLFPQRCAACGKPLADSFFGAYDFLCADCHDNLIRVEPPYCGFCGVGREYCVCTNRPHAYDRAAAPFYYDGAAKGAVLRMKFSGREGVAVFLAFEMKKEIESRFFGVRLDVLTCVPASRSGIAKRGFNQSRSLAENLKLSKELFPCLTEDFSLLYKKNAQVTQHSLGAKARRDTAQKLYTLSKNRDIRGKNILLIDDIITTGATADACAIALKNGGAAHVFAAAAALSRTLNDEKDEKKPEKMSKK